MDFLLIPLWQFYVLLGLVAFIPVLVFAYIFHKIPEMKAMVVAWLLKNILVRRFYETGQIEYRTAKPMGKGVFKGRGKNEYYKAPLHSNPIANKPNFLMKSRIPVYDQCAGKLMAVTQHSLLAMTVASTPENERTKLPNEIQQFAKEHGLEITVKKKKGKGETIKKKFSQLLTLDRSQLLDFFKETYDEGTFENLLDKHYMLGLKGRRGFGGTKIALIIIVILCVIGAIILLAFPNLLGGGAQAPPGGGV